MDWNNAVGVVGIIIGILFGVLSHWSSKALGAKLITEKELIRDKVLDIQQIWIGYRDRILNDRKIFNDSSRNQLDINIRIEDIEGNIAILGRFADRLHELS